jgi:peptide/nickel transport system permease protein
MKRRSSYSSIGHELLAQLGASFRFLGGRRIAAFGVGVIIVFFAFAVFIYLAGKFVIPFDPTSINISQALAGPSQAHPFGTDQLGSDIFRQVLYATPIDMFVPIMVVVVALLVGGIIGALAAYHGGLIDEVLMRVTDIFRAFPALVLALAIAAALGSSIQNAMLALMVVWWPTYARLARGEALVVKNREYVKFARVAGVSRFRLITRHIMPNIFPILIAYATVDVGYVLVFFSVLGYLGLGAQAPTPEWGRIVFTGQDFLQQAPWYPLFPAFMIFIVVMAFSLLGDGMRDLLDPRVRSAAVATA